MTRSVVGTHRTVLILGLTLGIVIAAAAGAVVVGRWEMARSARSQNAEMQRILRRIGPLAGSFPTGYRYGPPDCLAYPIPSNNLGLEICFDEAGRLVETVDRSSLRPQYASLTYDPSLATLRVPRSIVDHLLAKAKHSDR